ncbi:metal ABC transporter substrate-binding protein [Starkeya koreensis]|uniref:Metal ABC transporter substrate-binding protein n=1 Tax=Ancylobacter koreensis TaxID=266121 RepID=A0ABT0DQN4_9HYPH|nr:metal ABC transporter substrate-binding protein [Ancylobacter koreensis]MCK0209417.1 metal ABC transporter substrate-binding protein [Ancylobacter koreensis]
MKTIAKALAGAALLLSVAGTAAKAAPLDVFACVPEWASLVKAIGGERIANVTLATSALDNPEGMKPTPGLIASLGKANLIVCTGAGLEDGWLPSLLERANNPAIAKGKPGSFMASEFVKLIEDESDEVDHGHGQKSAGGGHMHGEGNPHIQGDPNNVRVIAGQLAKRLIALDPEGKDVYTANAKTFINQLTALTKELQTKAAPLKGASIAVQHGNSIYLLKWLGVRTAATVEPEPGVAPGPAHLAEIIGDVPKQKIRFIVYATYEDPAPSRFVAEKAKIPLVKLPFTVGGTPEANDLFGLYKDSVDRLLDGLAGRERS